MRSGEAPDEETERGAVRLDVWMWRARFFKTRSISAAQITKRGVRLTRNGKTRKVSKPGANLVTGDIVTFGRSVHIRTIEVLGIGTRRGPASEAALLYVEIDKDD